MKAQQTLAGRHKLVYNARSCQVSCAAFAAKDETGKQVREAIHYACAAPATVSKRGLTTHKATE